MSTETLSILENRDAIAIDQDELGRQGDRLSAVGPLEIWTKPLAHGDLAVALFNRGELVQPMTVDLRKLGVRPSDVVKDVWAGERVHPTGGAYTAPVPKHGAVLLLIRHAAK